MSGVNGRAAATVLGLIACATVACSGAADPFPTASPTPQPAPTPSRTASPTASPSASPSASPEPAALSCTLGSPENAGDVINGPGFDGGPAPAFDPARLYFVSDRTGGKGGDIWVAQRTADDGPFGAPENLGGGVNGTTNEGAPTLSQDELTIFFDRDDGGIWTASRSATNLPFEAAERLGDGINAPFAGFPALSADAVTLYFASVRPGGQGAMDIWLATRVDADDTFDDALNLGPIVNGPADDAMATVSADGLLLVFASTRPGGLGDWDLWMAERPSHTAPFGAPVNMGAEVNGPGFDGRPHLTGDGSHIWFMSDRPGGLGAVDIWRAPIDCGA